MVGRLHGWEESSIRGRLAREAEYRRLLFPSNSVSGGPATLPPSNTRPVGKGLITFHFGLEMLSVIK